jgi:hypothetical protein
VLLIAATGGIAAPAVGQHQRLALLNQLEAGHWELRDRATRAPAMHICLHNGRRLIQLRHPSSVCEQLIVSEIPSEVTVQYTCRGRGYGRTNIRLETGRLVQIQSQGIADGLPFDFALEGRRIGNCAF